MLVERLDPLADDPRWLAWDRFVAGHPRGAFPFLRGHLAALAATTRYSMAALLLTDRGAVRGLLPLAITPPPRRAVSLPFYEFGGPLFAADATAEEAAALLDAALATARAAGVTGPVEMRVAHGWHGPDAGVVRAVEYPYASLRLQPDPEAVWSTLSQKRVRWSVRKAERLGVEVVHNGSAAAVSREFYPAYLRWMRDRHGTPPLALAYWRNAQARLPGAWQLFQCRHEGRLVAQFLGFAVGERVALTTTLSDEDGWEVQAPDLALWAFIAWACRAGYRWFDLGAARYGGQRRFKEKWGCEFGVHERALYHDRPVTLDGAALAAPENPVFDRVHDAWRHLPLAVTEAVGPTIREYLTL